MASTNVLNQSGAAFATNSVAHAQNSVTTAEDLLTTTLNASTRAVLVQFNGADARVTFDGTTPTTSLGFLYEDGSTAYLSRKMADSAKVVSVSGTLTVEIQELNYVV